MIVGYDGEKYEFESQWQSDGVAQGSVYKMQCTSLSVSTSICLSY